MKKTPVRRAKILQAIEDNGKVLEEKYHKKQELSKRFNFNPSKKVKKMLDAIKNALDKNEKKDKKHKEPRAKRNSDDNSSSEDSDSESNDDESDDNEFDNQESIFTTKNQQSWWEKNKYFLIFGGLALSAILYIHFQDEEASSKTFNTND